MRLLVTATFVRVTEKLHKPQKEERDAVVRAISLEPSIGGEEVGDLLSEAAR